MQSSQIPAKFPIPFANAAGGSFIRNIPVSSQIGVNAGWASLTDGFVPLNFTPIASGGVPPFGQDFNGLLNQVTGWNRWQAAGGQVSYDAAWVANSGGYPLGAVLASTIVPGNYWLSTIENNVNDPDAGGAGWISHPAMMGTGHWQWRPVAANLPGWIIANGVSIGNAASGALQRANADCQLMFVYLWTNFSNTQCPIYASGVPVARGATALADFNANRAIIPLDMRSIGIIGVDVMGSVSGSNGLFAGVPFVSGSASQVASVLGENLHTLITAELAVHAHANSLFDPGHFHTWTGLDGGGGNTYAGGNPFRAGTFNTSTNTTGITITNANAGSGAAHNNVQRSMSGYFYIKL
jgi:hypothetical protein